ncbi:uncharacterized protein [Paramormyrops kingsleyae]|uniref:uncharacterized protein n=1 Tax=Paramormyrops kingsleyae TaxID=1676925 RepID=UPI003B97CAE5
MEAGSRKSVEVAALGRPFQLGMLYDCRDDCLIPGITMWDLEDLKKDSDERIQHNTEFDVIASDSVEDKAGALNFDASLKASFLGGLVEVDGSAKYLKDTKASKKQARVTLKYKTTTKFKQLSMSHLGQGNVKHPYVFEKGIATHVVTAVLYGAQAFFVFDREVSETEDQQNIEGNLQVMIKKIPKLSVEGEASLKMTDSDKATVDKLSCKFYGDFALKQNPVSFQDAVKVYTILPDLLGENGENAVPVRVWLLPLEIIDSSAARIVRQISVRLINETQSVIDYFNDIEMQCNDITKRKVISCFPEIGRKIKSFKNMCLEYKSVFQRSLSSILPSIRGGGTEECVLTNILTKKEQSPFNSNKLKEWLDCKEQEISLLQVYTDMMEDTKILATKSELQSEILKNRDKNVVCFAFTSLGEEEPYLSCLRSHLKALSTAKLTEPTEEDGKDVEPCEFYFSDAVSEKMNKQVFLFIDFAKANKENKTTHFISASIPNDEHKGASIYLYKDGIKKSDHFEPPSKPERPNASDITHDSVTIKLSHPQYGSSEITHYLVEYCAYESDGWQFIKVPKSNLECTVSGLLPHTDYRFRYKAVCPAGVSLTSEADSIKTLPTSPPGKPRQTYVDSEDYAVEYRTETNENKVDWKTKTSKDCHANLYPGASSQTVPSPTTLHMHTDLPVPPSDIPAKVSANQGFLPTAYGGLMQTHQVKNVQVFTGNADSKMLVEDWIRDMQYLLEAIELPAHLRFSTVVRHLSGEARKLVLNLPPQEQTPEKAFEELKAEYSDTQGSLDPLADFYERSQKAGESACSYAIALEAILRAVEESQRGGRPFPDRDSKLTRQFLQGLTDEEVYARIAPMKPRLLSFRELKAELRNLARETRRVQFQHKAKKAYAQVHITPECAVNERAERTRSSSRKCTGIFSAFKCLEPMVSGATMGKKQGPHPQVKKNGTGGEETPLVGPRNKGKVEVNGIQCRALIDSGSQVTTMIYSYWRNHPTLQSQKLLPSEVPIEGAAGQTIPYYGILYVDLKVLGNEYKAVPTFVVPDSDYRSSVPVLVGTNVIRASRSHLQAAYGQQFLHWVKEDHPEWYTALLEVESAEQCKLNGVVGPVVYTGKKVYIPGGKEMDLRCKVKVGPQRKTYTVLMESRASLQLPQGLLVAKVLADVTGGCAPVRVMNLSQHTVTLKPYTHLAVAVLVDNVLEFTDSRLGECHHDGGGETCLSLDQVVASCDVDLTEAAVENEH